MNFKLQLIPNNKNFSMGGWGIYDSASLLVFVVVSYPKKENCQRRHLFLHRQSTNYFIKSLGFKYNNAVLKSHKSLGDDFKFPRSNKVW